jgi:hypothetical protein
MKTTGLSAESLVLVERGDSAIRESMAFLRQLEEVLSQTERTRFRSMRVLSQWVLTRTCGSELPVIED